MAWGDPQPGYTCWRCGVWIPQGCTHSCPIAVIPWPQPQITWRTPVTPLPDPEDPRCECGHPKSAHRHDPDHPNTWPCVATVYETVPTGMNAWPCKCREFKEASE